MGSGALPCPGFEGFEKRLDIVFDYRRGPGHSIDHESKYGLRSVPRNELDLMLSLAECTIVSQLRNKFFDSYVLSESSLFIYPNRVVIKTCGTTKLLSCIPQLLESALKIGMEPSRCRYSRGTFMFPQAQPELHRNFSSEAKYLDNYFGHLGNGGKAYVLGDALSFPNWHVYVADSQTHRQPQSTYTLEMCMTKLDKMKAHQFFQTSGLTAAGLTKSSGIRDILPTSEIDDFLFEPCGYSMNGIEKSAHSTIHVTPEDGFSYASFETMGYSDTQVKVSSLLGKVLAVFRPDCFSVALHVDGLPQAGGTWSGTLPSIPGYRCDGTSRQMLPLKSCIVFHTFKRETCLEPHHIVEPLSLVGEPTEVPRPRHELRCQRIVHPDTDSSALNENLLKYGVKAARLVSDLDPVFIGSKDKDVDAFMLKSITHNNLEDPFYVMDISHVLSLWDCWTASMPRVRPFYAVKCNPDPVLISLLSSLGAGFDVASLEEIESALSIGAPPSDLIFANPCKLPSHMVKASKHGVGLTTFDSEVELMKFIKYYPDVKAVLRLRADDRGARCPLGVKYGAEYEDCEDLLLCAKNLGIHVVGVAFHVGSGASDPESYADGIQAARSLFDSAIRLGMPPMSLLDIGGGFTSEGGNGMSFKLASSVINDSLNRFFPDSMGVTIIAEPGRFFAEAPFTLAANVFGSRFRKSRSHGETKPEYWINDGLYGSMNCLLYDHAVLSTRPLKKSQEFNCDSSRNNPSDVLYKSTVFGPTCDGLDTILRDVWLPKLDCGDWLVFPRMGAYTQAAGSSFNGFDTSKISTRYVLSTTSQHRSPASDQWSSDGYSSSDSGDERAFQSLPGESCTEGSGSCSSDDDSF